MTNICFNCQWNQELCEFHLHKKRMKSRPSRFLANAGSFKRILFANWGVISGLTQVLIFFRRWHRIFLERLVSQIHSKGFPLIRLDLLTALRLTGEKEFCEISFEWPFLAFLHTVEEVDTHLFIVLRYLPIILDISNVDLLFASSGIRM